jgi:chromosome segregation ATPase
MRDTMEKAYTTAYEEWRVACTEAQRRREMLEERIHSRVELRKIQWELEFWEKEMEKLHQKLNEMEWELLKLDEDIWRMEAGEVLE